MDRSMTENAADYRAGGAGLEAFAERYRTDPGARSRPAELAREFGMALPAEVEARVAEDSDGVTHVVFPPDPNAALDDEALAAVSGGTKYGRGEQPRLHHKHREQHEGAVVVTGAAAAGFARPLTNGGLSYKKPSWIASRNGGRNTYQGSETCK